MNLMSERFAQFLHDFESHVFKGTIPRLANLLLERTEDDAVCGLTHKDIARDLGIHRESVSAALGELRRAGIISTARKAIRILEPSRLERAARE
jgi:CRP-like cAMP-binding protein